MTAKAKVFSNGGHQAVRLPKSCRFPASQREVAVHREGRRLILEPVDEWTPEFLAALGAWNHEIELPPQTAISSLRTSSSDRREHHVGYRRVSKR
jgi:antitoxin VapB